MQELHHLALSETLACQLPRHQGFCRRWHPVQSSFDSHSSGDLLDASVDVVILLEVLVDPLVHLVSHGLHLHEQLVVEVMHLKLLVPQLLVQPSLLLLKPLCLLLLSFLFPLALLLHFALDLHLLLLQSSLVLCFCCCDFCLAFCNLTPNIHILLCKLS